MDAVQPFLPPVEPQWLVIAAASVGLLLLVFLIVVLRMLLRRRQRKPDDATIDLRIDLATWPAHGPPGDGARLTVLGMPVRLAAVVVAPAGRHAALPSDSELPAVLDDLLPGLGEVARTHRPEVFYWPRQLSTHGFVHTFFHHASLPGEHGKGTVWCSLAGRFETGHQQLLAGLICAADKPNSLGQFTIHHPGHWLEVLRASIGPTMNSD